MKKLNFDSHVLFMQVFGYFSGRYKSNGSLPENTCQLFWQVARTVAFFPLTFIGSIVYNSINDEYQYDFAGLWPRFGTQIVVFLGYISFFIVGDGFVGHYFLDIPDKELAISHLNWLGYIYLPILGILLLGLPTAIIVGIGFLMYKGMTYTKEKYDDSASENFGLEWDHEEDLPKNKFWATLYTIHDKTCAKINWE